MCDRFGQVIRPAHDFRTRCGASVAFPVSVSAAIVKIMANEVLIPLISAASGLLGVAVGGYFAAHNQMRARQQQFIREQLSEFYGPMLALRAQVLAKSEIRLRIDGAADTAWRKNVGGAHKGGIAEVEKLTQERFPLFAKIIDENNRQLAEEIIPAYRNMFELFVSKMHLIESSTRQHLTALTEFVEVWNRWLGGSIPAEVAQQLEHSEKKVYPLYENISENFERLQKQLRER